MVKLWETNKVRQSAITESVLWHHVRTFSMCVSSRWSQDCQIGRFAAKFLKFSQEIWPCFRLIGCLAFLSVFMVVWLKIFSVGHFHGYLAKIFFVSHLVLSWPFSKLLRWNSFCWPFGFFYGHFYNRLAKNFLLAIWLFWSSFHSHLAENFFHWPFLKICLYFGAKLSTTTPFFELTSLCVLFALFSKNKAMWPYNCACRIVQTCYSCCGL